MDAKIARVLAGAGASIALFSAGSVAGYFYAKRKLVAQFDEMLQDEIMDARRYYKEHYKKLNKVEEFATLDEAVEALGVDNNRTPQERQFDAAVAAMRSYKPDGDVTVSDSTIEEAEAVLREDRGKNVVSYNGVMTDPVSGETVGQAPVAPNFEPKLVQRNVFSGPPGSDVDFDYADEIKARTKDRPYIVSQQEFNENDPGHEQVTMTYYEGDKTMADPNDQPVGLVEETIGWDNLRFGHRSGDDNVVFIRHEMYTLDMEIVRDHRTYGEVVGGFVERTGLG